MLKSSPVNSSKHLPCSLTSVSPSVCTCVCVCVCVHLYLCICECVEVCVNTNDVRGLRILAQREYMLGSNYRGLKNIVFEDFYVLYVFIIVLSEIRPETTVMVDWA